MKTQELNRQYQKLSSLFSRTAAATNNDFEIQGHWAKYLCVLSAGFLENALREVYKCYCAKCANPNVAKFSGEKLKRVKNPKTNRFLETAKSFNSGWETDLSAFVEIDGRREAINSIMANRHLIAHGKDTNITIVRLKEYLEKSVTVVEFIENQCGL